MAVSRFRGRIEEGKNFDPSQVTAFMLSPEQLETYRLLSPSERIALSLKMTSDQWPAMIRGTPNQIDRRFELLNRENDLRNQNILEKLAKSVLPQTDQQP